MKPVYGVEDVKELFGVSDSKAYALIRTLNGELEEKGFMTVRGRVSSKYFHERFFGTQEAK